jgi:hypothetical protein
VTPAQAPAVPGPVIGAAVWREVTSRAGDRCECTGGCGRKHRDGDGRCKLENAAASPLHAVPAEDIPDVITAAGLPARALTALCDSCHAGLASMRARARKAASGALSAAETLF